MGFETAVVALYRAPHAEFVATRKKLAGDLAAHGDVDGAARLVRLARPPLSVWVVNQLWWHARPVFQTLIESAERLRDGDSKGGNPYRDAMAKLRARATALLTDDGHAASEQTLRKVTMSLAAIATSGGWDPDPPGALAADREPGGPGGEHGEVTVTVRAHRAPTEGSRDDDDTVPPPLRTMQPPPPPKPRPKGVVANGRVHPHVEMHTDDDVLTSVVTERSLLEAALSTARATIEASERERESLQRRLQEVEHSIHQAKVIVADVVARLGDGND